MIYMFVIFLGMIFAFAMVKSEVYFPRKIINQFLLKDFSMLKVFLTALIVSSVIYNILFLSYDPLQWKKFYKIEDALGGALLGLGMVLTGSCPGTVFAQLGSLSKKAGIVFLGGLFGNYLYDKLALVKSGELVYLYQSGDFFYSSIIFIGLCETILIGIYLYERSKKLQK